MPFEWVKEAGARVGRCMWTDQRHIALSEEERQSGGKLATDGKRP